MDKEQQRIKIAEACGYTDIMLPMGFHQQKSDEKAKQCGGRWRFEIPNYPEDLNAMHEAEKVLNFVSLRNYYCELRTLCCPPEPHNLTATECAFLIFIATAAQRAEAFLRTLNLWE